MLSELLKRLRVLFIEVVAAFTRNKDLTAASSLAFSSTLALIPTLFLLTFVLSAAIGSSGRALAKTQELLSQIIPAYSQDILREVSFITAHKGAIGLVNGLILLWSVTPLVADLRVSLGSIFRKKPSRPFLLEKLVDVAISIVFLAGLSATAAAGIIFSLIEKKSHLHLSLGHLNGVVPFFFVTGVVFLLYFAFSPKMRFRDLISGALLTSLLWFIMTPAFHLFLTFNPGYGFAFGSFKSLFVVIIWIYYSLVVFLIGAEVAACLGKDETVFIKHLMEGKTNVPARVIGKFVTRHEQGSIIFNEGDPGNALFCVLKGAVSIRKDDHVIGVIPAGKCFGGISFLLSTPRAAMAVALEEVELVSLGNENINKLMNEYPEFVVEMLRDMALRLREANKLVD
jgi:membrane protein